MRAHIPKSVKERVRNKYDGKCAYCGIESQKLQIDHMFPVARAHMLPSFNADAEANLMPACASCNNYKMSFDVEGFRNQLEDQVERARKYCLNFRLAERFGLVEALNRKVVFYFESQNAKESSHD